MFRRSCVLCLCSLAFAATALANEPSLHRFDRVQIAPTKTSIYVGSVTMTMPPFVRHTGVYESNYSAKVFPFFFLNEKGSIAITVPDDALRRVARGESIEFAGHGVSSSGEMRRLVGRATPTDASSGIITVRVFVSRHIELIFHTTYRFIDR